MLTLSYVGGGSFSNDGTASNGVIQGLNFSERLLLSTLCALLLQSTLSMHLRRRLGQPEFPTVRHCPAVERWVSGTAIRRDNRF